MEEWWGWNVKASCVSSVCACVVCVWNILSKQVRSFWANSAVAERVVVGARGRQIATAREHERVGGKEREREIRETLPVIGSQCNNKHANTIYPHFPLRPYPLVFIFVWVRWSLPFVCVCVSALVWSYLSSLIISFVAFSFCLSCCCLLLLLFRLTGWQQQQQQQKCGNVRKDFRHARQTQRTPSAWLLQGKKYTNRYPLREKGYFNCWIKIILIFVFI